mgnify:CR=1 FL=1
MQNIIAIIWDFDKTLIDGYMQEPIFDEYHVDPREFWTKVNEMPNLYAEQNIRVNPDTAYLLEFTRRAKSGEFKGLNNAKLRSYGKKQKFYPGIPEFIKESKSFLKANPECEEFNVKVEHYIVSTGFAEVIRGTELANLVDGIWGCELLEDSDIDGNKVISEPCYMIDNTSKTRALFEINKGVNKKTTINVNVKMNDGQRRVSFKNMIYIADGPSDVPAFSVTKLYGGSTFAIYPHGDAEAFRQIEQLRHDERIDYYAEADYRKDTPAYMWIKETIMTYANRIIQDEKNNQAVVGIVPRHII